MTKDEREQIKKAYEEFTSACQKFSRWFELSETDGFYPDCDAAKILQELKETFSTPKLIELFDQEYEGTSTFAEEVAYLESQVLYNEVANYTDLIYAQLLGSAKYIAGYLNDLGIGLEEFLRKIENAGIIKHEIDEEKEYDEMQAQRLLYPPTQKTEVLLGKELRKFLFE